jgi:hypothetical protein
MFGTLGARNGHGDFPKVFDTHVQLADGQTPSHAPPANGLTKIDAKQRTERDADLTVMTAVLFSAGPVGVDLGLDREFVERALPLPGIEQVELQSPNTILCEFDILGGRAPVGQPQDRFFVL